MKEPEDIIGGTPVDFGGGEYVSDETETMLNNHDFIMRAENRWRPHEEVPQEQPLSIGDFL